MNSKKTGNEQIEKLIIGKLTKPQGLKGEIRMHYYGNDPDSLQHLNIISIVKADNNVIDLELERMRVSKNTLILKFKGFDSIDDAQNLAGSTVHIDKAKLKNPKKDEYYWDDLIGIIVYDETGVILGELTEIFETGSNDVYVVRSGKKELLIPAIKEVIKKIDVCKKVMHVHLLEGMRDDI